MKVFTTFLLALMCSTTAIAAETVATFDPFTSNPESMAIDSHGDLFVVMSLAGKIVKVDGETGAQEDFAVLPVGTLDFPTFGGFTGAVAIDITDDLYVSLSSSNPADRGVWKIDCDGNVSQVVQLPMDSAPNGIALLGPRIFIADAIGGRIFRVNKDGSDLEVWSDDVLLKGIPGVPLPSANGVQYHKGHLFVAVSATGLMVKINVFTREASVHAVLSQGCDDFAITLRGAIYCTTDLHQTVTRISRDGLEETVVLEASDGLDGPTAAVFGRGSFLEGLTLYVTNGAFPFPAPPGFPPPPGNGPSVVKVMVGEFGFPRHLLSY